MRALTGRSSEPRRGPPPRCRGRNGHGSGYSRPPPAGAARPGIIESWPIPRPSSSSTTRTSVQKLLAYPLERDGYRVVPARDGEEALERFARAARRPRRPRHHAPEARRARGLQAPARPEHGADHHAHGPRRRARQGARARARRRRLHHEAVLDPRVPEPRAGAAAPRGRAPADDRATTRRSSADGLAIDLARRDGRGGRTRRPAHLRRVRAPAHARLDPGPRLHAGRCCSRRSGAAPTTASRARSTSTSATCGRSSRRDPREPEFIHTVRGVGYRFRDA